MREYRGDVKIGFSLLRGYYSIFCEKSRFAGEE